MKHKAKVALRETENPVEKQQRLLLSQGSSSTSEFATDPSKLFITTNVPLYKLEHPQWVKFFEKHCKKTVPSRRTLTRIMEQQCQETLAGVKDR